jgi:hypothetical protein
MDGGMDKGVFTIFGEEFLAVLPIAAIATALNILLCLTLPSFFALPLCAVCSVLGMMLSFVTVGSNMAYMLRNEPFQCQCQPEGKFAHFCKHFDYLVCNGILLAMGLTASGAACRALGINIDASKEKDDITIHHRAMLQALSFETTRDKIPYFAAGIFGFNFTSFCLPRCAFEMFPLIMIAICFCFPPSDPNDDYYY